MKKKFVWSMPLAAFMVAAALMAFSSPPTKIVEAKPGDHGNAEHCDGDVKIEDNWAHVVAPEGKAILSVCIKAGNKTYTFPWGDTGDGCYELSYRCHCEVTVTGGGLGRNCKEISYISVTFEDIDCDVYK